MRAAFFAAIVSLVAIGGASAQVNPTLVAPVCGQFTPMVDKPDPSSSYVHFFAKNCNKVLIGDAIETIPPGTGVANGGVVLDSRCAYIQKVACQPMQPGTTYFVYVFCVSYTPTCNMALNLDTAGHKESPDYGHEVHQSDRGQTLEGMVRLMKDNLIAGTVGQQPTVSWHNRGETALAQHIGNGQPRARTCSPTWAVPDAIDTAGNVIPGANPFSMEWLSFAINSQLGPYLPPGYPAQYGQAFTVPDVKLFGTMTTSVAGGEGYVIFGDGAGHTISAPSYFRHESGHTYGNLYVEEFGAVPDNEGYAKVQLLMRTGGTGCVTIEWGTLGVDQLKS